MKAEVLEKTDTRTEGGDVCNPLKIGADVEGPSEQPTGVRKEHQGSQRKGAVQEGNQTAGWMLSIEQN